MFGENLKAMRKAKGYTQEELAIKINVVRQTVSKWEKGLSVPDSEGHAFESHRAYQTKEPPKGGFFVDLQGFFGF